MRFQLVKQLKEESKGYYDGYIKGQLDFINRLNKNCVCFGSDIYKEAYKLGYERGYNYSLEMFQFNETVENNNKVKIRNRKHDIL